MREDIREIITVLCKYKDIEIIAGAVCMDHVHLSVTIPIDPMMKHGVNLPKRKNFGYSIT